MTTRTTLFLLALFGGCSSTSLESQVVRQYAVNLHANYADVVTAVEALQTSVDAFIQSPTADGLEAAKSAWTAARPIYGQCEVSRFYGGPIDQAQGGMNEWPIDENFIDYTAGNPMGGIINLPSQYPQLTVDVLETADEQGGVENLSTGFHAIEFLLWGQRADQTDGPGDRPFTDYVDGGTAANQDRRRTYLKTVTEILVADMKALTAAWDLSDRGSYGAKLVAGPSHDGVTKILEGFSNMAISELYYERLSDPFRTQDRKDEESCFSESTYDDLVANALGVENVYLGHYGALAGASISDLVRAKDSSLDEQMRDQLTAVRAAIAAIPQPFDHSVLAPADSDANQKVKAAIDAFLPVQPTIDSVAKMLKVQINL